jgi:hypothetical protein
VRRAEAIWTRILGIALIVLGATLLASPYFAYTARERIPHTQFSVKHEKTLVAPRPVAILIIAVGATALFFHRKDENRSTGTSTACRRAFSAT